MSDWDVIGAYKGEAGDEEEGYEEEYEEEYEESASLGECETMNSCSYTPSSLTAFEIPQGEAAVPVQGAHHVELPKTRRQDRFAYHHRVGAGFRKQLLNTGKDISDGLFLYQEGCHSFGDDMLRLREASLPDAPVGSDAKQITGGAASKIIQITKVRKGTLNHHHNIHDPVFKSDIVSQKTDLDPRHYWDHVSHELLEDGNFVQAKYDAFHEKAIAERQSLGVGNSAEMNSLYCFWCFYLREHFNQEMYDEFLKLAAEDLGGGSHYAIECFFRFASYGLEKVWNEEIYNRFQTEALNDYRRGSTYGMEKFKAFHLNQKHPFPIPISPDVKAIMDKYPTLKSFHEAPPQKKSHKSAKKAPNPYVEDFKPTTEETPKPAAGLYKPPIATNAPRPPPPSNPNHQARPHPAGPVQRNGGWTFGRMQPSSAPMDSPMRRGW